MDFCHFTLWRLDGRLIIHPPPPCNVITLKVDGLWYLVGSPERLQMGHLLTTHMSRIPNSS
jgi:hypothetical protein